MKTPLTHVQGREHLRGDPDQARRLARILRLTDAERDVATEGIHAVHPYPARMHPLWARRILTDLPDEVSVLDPFCGSGTVLVEARRRGVHARGSDVNPIAVRLARLRCIPHAPIEVIREEGGRCADGCMTRRKTPFSALAEGEKSYPPHLLAGLISLRDEIEKTSDEKARELLLFCLSPLLHKLAAGRDGNHKRFPRTAVRDGFVQRVERWIETYEAMEGCRWAEAEIADARWLPWKPGSSSACITSPPYPGVYDYAGEQLQRQRWIGGADKDGLEWARPREIGRRGAKRGAKRSWRQDMTFAMRQLARTLRPGSPLYMLVGDGVGERGRAIRVDRALEQACEGLPLNLVAVASQERPHFHRATAQAFTPERPRLEHLMFFERTDDVLEREPPGRRRGSR